MGAYILKRILLMIPTLLGIMLMTFAVIQFVPGGPVEQVIAKMQGNDTDSTGRISGNTGNEAGGNQADETVPSRVLVEREYQEHFLSPSWRLGNLSRPRLDTSLPCDLHQEPPKVAA